MPLVDSFVLDRTRGRTDRPVNFEGADLLTRARLLPEHERQLLRYAFERHFSMREIGMILHRPAGTVTRQLQRICRRLRDPATLLLLSGQCTLDRTSKEIALDHFLLGHPRRRIARQRAIPLRQVCHIVLLTRGLARLVRASAAPVAAGGDA